MSGWKDATAVERLSANSYSCNLQDDWAIGSVPNGGYVTGCILEVVRMHFSTSLAKQDQPHTIALHVEFLRRTQTGPAFFKVDDVKLGRQTSTVHVTLEQDGRQEVVAYVTNSNMNKEEGLSFVTDYQLSPPVTPVDLTRLESDEDLNWKWQEKMPARHFRKAIQRVKFHFPREGHKKQNLADEWICWADGTNFIDSSIGFAADTFPQIVERYVQSKSLLWYPTLLLNLDIKKTLPPEGVKWLHVRVEMKKIKNGRMDLEVHILDAEGDLVAQSSHVGFVVDASRNVSARRKEGSKI